MTAMRTQPSNLEARNAAVTMRPARASDGRPLTIARSAKRGHACGCPAPVEAASLALGWASRYAARSRAGETCV